MPPRKPLFAATALVVSTLLDLLLAKVGLPVRSAAAFGHSAAAPPKQMM